MRKPLFHLALACVLSSQVCAVEKKPNIVFLLADDLGWADVSFHGGKINTPNIDALVKRGVRMEQFYAEPVCSPTRAALMTGRYPRRFGITTPLSFPSRNGVPLDERTLAEALREAGYFTAIVGKWHIGHAQPEQLPTHRGFDHQYGLHAGEIDFFKHTNPRFGDSDWYRDDKPVVEEGYSTHLLAREAVHIIQRHDEAKPLFLYMAFNAVHSPHQAPDRYIAPYASFSSAERRGYAGQTAAMDEAIGQILAALDERHMRESTLIIFCSDNGGPSPPRIADNGRLRGGKGSVFEGGVRVPCAAVWDGVLQSGKTWDGLMHVSDWYPTLIKLAGGSLVQKKALDGVDVWPGLSSGGSSSRAEIFHNIGTTCDALRLGDWKLVRNGTRPGMAGGDGAASEEGETPQRAKQTKTANKAVDAGDIWMLFDLANDPFEQTDLAAREPERVRTMRLRLESLIGSMKSG